MKASIIVAALLLSVQLKLATTQTVVTCSCDLTGSACDANCCCDPNCSPSDTSTFECSTATLNEDSQLCVNDLVYVNNLPSSQVVYDNGLFCIIRQSDTSQNFYTEPTILNGTASFEAAALEYPTFSYDLTTATTSTTTNYYRSGDTIGIQYSNGVQGTLSFPVAGTTTLCLSSNPAAFMTDQTSSCGRRFVLASACTNGSVLDADSYYSPDLFRIAQLPFLNGTTSGSLINITLCNGATVAALLYDSASATCSNAVSSVSYTITYNGTAGIEAACASFTQVTQTSTSLMQTFSINFVASNTVANQTSSRSGNPGYVIGKPIRSAVTINGSRTLSTEVLTLLAADANGECPTTSITQQINFGEDARTGCLISFVQTRNCSSLYNEIISFLNEPANVEVANYGNTLVNSTTANDWLALTGSLPAGPSADSTTTVSDANGCTGMLVAINYNVFYANTGSLSNPQPEIIGVSYSGSTKTVKFECSGTNCLSDTSTQALEISSTVTFTDTSSSPSSILRQRPTVDARLPSDFFFPFTGTST